MPTPRRKAHGTLTTSVTTSTGRKIDTWTFRPGDVAGARPRENEIVFEVSLTKDLEFAVNTKQIPAERWQPLTGKVLADLHKQAQDIARSEFDLANQLTWSDWLEVRVQEASFHDRRDVQAIGQAHVSYTALPRAETPDGLAYTINGNGLLVRFPESVGVARNVDGLTGTRRDPAKEEAIKAQHPDGQFGSRRLSALLNAADHRDPNTQFVYLPDTPENRAGLDAIIAAIEGINQRLQQFLDPQEITQTLTRALASGTRLLAGPEASAEEPAAPPRRRGP